jgi:hypothetical protein
MLEKEPKSNMNKQYLIDKRILNETSPTTKMIKKEKFKTNCSFCKKQFISYKHKSKIGKLKFEVVNCYCSKKCEIAMNKAIKKCFSGKKLTKSEKNAIKDLRYIDIHI